MRNFKKLLSAALSLAMVCSAVGTTASVTASAESTSLPVLTGNYSTALEFSDLAPSETAYCDVGRDQCSLDTTSALFAGGYMVDSAENIGAGKTNFHGFYARDIDNDGGSDYIEAFSYNADGMNFTLGMKNPAANGKAIAIRMESNFQGSFDGWSQGFGFTLNTADGSYALLGAADASDNYYYVSGGAVSTYNYKNEGWFHMPLRYQDGWLIIPLTLFANGDQIDTSELTSIRINASSYWGIYFRIYELGVVTDLDGFFGNVTPIDETDYAVAATNFGDLTPSDEAYLDKENGWNCQLNTESEIFADGYMLDTPVSGIGADKTNFHGFYARDIDGDGGTDCLEAYPYDAGGMRFTMVMTEDTRTTGEAIAVRMQSAFAGGLEGWGQGFGFTLNTATESYGMLGANQVKSNVNYYFYTAAGQLTAFNYKTEGWAHLPASYGDGWLILPLTMFADGKNIDTQDIESILFSLSSYWGTNTRIYGVSYVTDMYALLKMERPAPEIAESEYLEQMNTYADVPASRTAYVNTDGTCVRASDTALFTSGAMVNKETMGVIELSTGTTNFHGVYVNDVDGDGTSDQLEFYPRDNRGINFTLGMNGTATAGASAIAIHFGNNGTGDWNPNVWINTDIVLNMKDGTSAPLLKSLENDYCAYYYADSDRSVTVRNMDADACNGYIVRACTPGWLVLPAYAFGGIDTANIASVSFNMASTWSYNMTIGEICAVTDMNSFLNRVLGDADGNGLVEANELVNLRQMLLGIFDVANGDRLICDLNGDCAVDIRDLVRLKKIFVA